MKIVNSIANYYVKQSIITEEQEEIFKLGISLFVGAVLNYSVILLLACAAGQITYGITFLICFYFTRIFCGGFHARTAGKCRAVFIGTFALVLLMANICPSCFVLMTIILGNVVSFVMIVVFAPVEHPNKQLTLEQSKKARRHGVTVICPYVLG